MESIVTMGMRPDRDRHQPDGTGAAPGPDARQAQLRDHWQEELNREKERQRMERHARRQSTGGKEGAASPAKGKAGTAAVNRHRAEQALQKRRAARERAALREKKRQYRLIAEYVIGTVVVCYILLHLTDNVGLVLKAAGRGIRMVGMLLQPLFWGFVLAYILSPLVGACERRLRRVPALRKGLRKGRKGLRAPAVAITCVLTLLGLTALCSVAVSAVSRSLKVASLDDVVLMVQSFAGTLGNFQQTVMDRLNALNISSAEVTGALRGIGERLAAFTKGLSSGLTGAAGNIGSFLTSALFAVIFAIYFLLDGSGLKRYWNRVLLAVGGRRTRRNFHILARDADAVFSGYIRGQLIDALIMAVLVGASLSVVGVRYAVIIGVLSGLGNLIPYVGPVVAYGSTVLVCVLTGDLKRLLVALVVLFVIQTLDGNVINPRLLSSSIDVHPMLVIAALIIGGAAGGLVGMLFAVPAAAFLKIQFDKVIDALLRARVPEAGRGSRRGRKAKAAPAPRRRRSGKGKLR